MPRPAQFDRDSILDAALAEGRRKGFERVSAARVAARLAAPSGSIYHRYATRDALMADLWLRTVERFQQDYLQVLREPRSPLDRGRATAVMVLDWCDTNRAEAELLARYRREDLLHGDLPETVIKRAQGINAQAVQEFADFAAQFSRPMSLGRVRFACITVPLAVVRDALKEQKKIPPEARRWVDETVIALLTKGSQS